MLLPKASRFFFLILVLLSLAPAGSGIGMRHDVDEVEYLNLATNTGVYGGSGYPRFDAVGAVGVLYSNSHFDVIGSATLIAPQWVITAAHVVLTKKKRDGDFVAGVRLRFGQDALAGFDEYVATEVAIPLDVDELRPLKGSNWRFSEKKIVNAEFHDVALLKLDRPVEGLQPLPLHMEDVSLLNQRILIAGYGHAGKGDNPGEAAWTPARYRRAAENMVDRDITVNPYTEETTGGLILFDFDNGDEERNTLQEVRSGAWQRLFGTGTSSAEPLPLEGASYPGDSGGPALALINGVWKIVGVSGYGTGYPPDKRRTTITYGDILVFTRIRGHSDWITRVISP